MERVGLESFAERTGLEALHPHTPHPIANSLAYSLNHFSDALHPLSCNEDVNIVNLLLDGSRVAYGGLSINATMGANVGPDIFVINFVNAGISVNGGHEVMIHESWLGALYYSAKNKTVHPRHD